MIDLRYLRPGDVVRVERGGKVVYGFVVRFDAGGSERFPEREVVLLPMMPGVPYPDTVEWLSCTRDEIAGVWHPDAQTRRTHPQGADAYEEWAEARS